MELTLDADLFWNLHVPEHFFFSYFNTAGSLACFFWNTPNRRSGFGSDEHVP